MVWFLKYSRYYFKLLSFVVFEYMSLYIILGKEIVILSYG